MGLSWALTGLYALLLASHGLVRATVGLNWPLMGLTLASHRHLRASTGLNRPLMDHYGPIGPVMGLYGPLRTSTRIHRPFAGLYEPLRASVGLTWASHGPLRASTGFSRLLMGLYWIVSHGFLVLVFFPWLPRSPFCSGGVWGEGSALSCSNWRFVWLATLFWALVGALNPRDFSFSTSYIVLRPRLKSFPFFVMFS